MNKLVKRTIIIFSLLLATLIITFFIFPKIFLNFSMWSYSKMNNGEIIGKTADLTYLQDLVSKNPGDENAHYKLGYYYLFKASNYKAKDFQDKFDSYINLAFEEFANILDINQNCLLGHQGLGFLYYLKGEYANSINYYKKVLEIDKDNFGALMSIGFIYKDLLKDYDNAILYLNKAKIVAQKRNIPEEDGDYKKLLEALNGL